MRFKRIFTIVIDSVGCGSEENSAKYGDDGANTIAHIAKSCGGITLPTMEKLGYGNLTDILGVKPVKNAIGAYGKAKEISLGKDTLTGHFEIMGLNVTKPFQTFTDNGFPKALIQELEEKTGYKVIGNCAASGTEIIKELGEEHLKTKAMIVYTSSDSVLQIACHEEVFGLEELYRVCKIAREICMKPEWQVGRIIARPFVGTCADDFKRTANRHDYAVSPFAKTTLDNLKEANFSVIGLGKISDIYNGCGITKSIRQASNHEGMEHMINIAKNEDFTGLCYLNLVDFDALYGHRRNPEGYKECLEEFDSQLATLLDVLNKDDLVLITADHGNDPTWKGTDHTREYTPILAYATGLKPVDLGIRQTFADLGQTIAENFDVTRQTIGTSFLNDLVTE